MNQKVPVSVIVPIKNEAANLPRCLASVAWADEIFVIDSQSSDGSERIAAEHGARVVQFHFNGIWPKKKNWALENLPFKHEWVFILDADEVLPPATEVEVRTIVTNPENPFAGYWINRRFMFMGTWLRHAYYPNWNLRLFKHRLGRLEQLTAADTQSGDNEVHEHVMVDGPVGYLQSEMDHYAFPSVGVFVEKHNRYSNWEARVALDHYLSECVSRPQKRNVGLRRRLKRLSQSLPCRSLLRFLYVYVFQRGFLDGFQGYYFARLHGMYELLSVAKTYELKLTTVRNQRGFDSTPSNGTGRGNLRRRIDAATVPLLFFVTVATVLYVALKPNPNGEIYRVLPGPVSHWCSGHADLNHIAVFGALAFLTLHLGRKLRERVDLSNFTIAEGWTRVAALVGFIGAIEFFQIWIPGRTGSLRDILSGSSGVLLAWSAYVILNRMLPGLHSIAAPFRRSFGIGTPRGTPEKSL